MKDHPDESDFSMPRLADLLTHYKKESSFFASPRGAMLAEGKAMALASADLLDRLAHKEYAQPILAALPFRGDGLAQVFVPERIRHLAGPFRPPASPQCASPMAKPSVFKQVPSPDQYRRNVREALARIQDKALEKVVMARSLTVDTAVDLPGLLACLAARNPRGYTFALNLAAQAQGRRVLIGASPELLLAKRGRSMISNPLAGSIPRSTDPIEDAQRAQGLLRSAKDLHEHALVVDAVAAALRPLCSRIDVPPEPLLISTPTMWHLSTEVRGEVDDPSVSSLALALALHPTPAVCGHPTAQAQKFIEECEGFDRGLYTGLVGWNDANGNGEWAVTIRCAEVGERETTLYAGAGIVAGSDPALELAETSAKLRTMLSAMGLDALLDTPQEQAKPVSVSL